MPSLLVLDKQAQETATKLKKYAESHRICLPTMKKIVAGKLPPAGSNPKFSAFFVKGYRVVYTVEEHPLRDNPGIGKWFHHISCSLETHDPENLVPHPAAISQLMEMFGIKARMSDCVVYLEDTIAPKAVNVIAPYEEE